ncbi:RidA family protein [Demequina sp. TTPB684]|uniref:RidA family protein n=1 Tax=unclassified Demequina TaxID=2620311 RepID=UPI001CF1ADCF|nr:RidA family protein [Demequina sp. TMPB413]MCB2411501.1 RidA family protein [Demequina sp. TTPB684]UPU87312.1 RidA family protein [Demequina sp. TMPB413]
MDTERRLISSGSPFEQEIGYSRAVVVGPWAWVSGTTGYDYETMTISADPAEQAEQALQNISTALGSVGMGLEDVVRVRYLLTRREDAAACFPVFGRWFKGIRPAATMEVVGLLDEAMSIEIEVTAYRPER